MLLLQHIPAFQQEFFGSLCKHLILFPDKAHTSFHLWRKGTETEAALTGNIDDLIKADGVSNAFVHHERAVKKEVIGRHNI